MFLLSFMLHWLTNCENKPIWRGFFHNLHPPNKLELRELQLLLIRRIRKIDYFLAVEEFAFS